MTRRLLCWMAVGLLGAIAPAAPWRSTLYPTNWQPPAATSASFETDKLLQDFSFAGYRAGETPIPDVAGPVFNAALPPFNADPSGAADATTAIQSAIGTARIAGGGVVYLPAGLYQIRPQGGASHALRINSSSIILRGAGVGRTFLLNTATNMRSRCVVLIEGPSSAGFYSSGAGSTTLSSDLMGPTSVLPVSSTSGFGVGQYVVVRADCTDAWITEHNEPGWLGFGSSLRGPAYFRQVRAVDAAARTLTLDAPTRYYLKTRDNARVVRLSTGPITEVGLEDVSLGNVQHPGTGWKEEDYNYSTNAAYEVHASYLIKVVRVRDAWVRRVESFQAASNTFTCHLLSNGLLVNDSSRVTVRAVHLQRPQFGGGGGNGYMYRLQSANDCLLQDSRATFSRHGFVLSHMGSSGNVFHRCVDAETGRQTGDKGSQNTSGQSSDHHMHFSHSNLIDASTGDSSWWEARYRPYGSEPLHNLTSAHGVFWNLLGLGSGASYVVRTEQSRYGYAIGTRGTRAGVDRPTGGGSKCNPPDHVEGVGLGDTLEPFSLYEDQWIRRLQLPEVSVPAEISLAFPSNSVRVPANVSVGRQPATPGLFTAAWRVVAGPGPVFFSDQTAAQPLVTFAERGGHELEVVVHSNGRQAAGRVRVTLLPDRAFLTDALAPVADAYVRDGSYAGDNYGRNTTLLLKKSSTGYNRRVFLRFHLVGATNAAYTRAFLELHGAAPWTVTDAASAEARLVPNDSWNETAVTWTNQPATSDLIRSWTMSPSGVDRIEVTGAALAERAGDGQLSLGLFITSQPGDLVYSYHSREAAADLRPRLLLERELAAPTFADWISGFPAVAPALRHPAANPDHDLCNNAEEYLFLRDPAVPEAGSAWVFRQVTGGCALEFPQRKGLPPDFAYVIESSPTLTGNSWQPAPGVEFRVLADLGAAVLMQAFLPEGDRAAPRFYRLRFRLPQP